MNQTAAAGLSCKQLEMTHNCRKFSLKYGLGTQHAISAHLNAV